MFKAYGGIFVLDDKADPTLLKKLSENCPGKFSFEHIDGAFKITKCDQEVILEIFKLDRDISTMIDAIGNDRGPCYEELLLGFLDKFFDYMNSFNNADELRLGLVRVADCLRGNKLPSEEISELLYDLDKRVDIILKDLLKIAIDTNNLSDFSDKLIHQVYSVLSAIGSAVKRYVSKLDSHDLSIVFGDKLTGPIFEQINDKYLNGVKVLNVEVNGVCKQHLAYISNMLGQTGNKVYYLMTGDNTGALIVIACNGFEIVYDR